MGDVAPPHTFPHWHKREPETTSTVHLWVNDVTGLKLRVQTVYQGLSEQIAGYRLQYRPRGPDVKRYTRWENVDDPMYDEQTVARVAHAFARRYNERKHPESGEGFSVEPL